MEETRTFGDYQIIKEIGQGVLGAVYLAEHRFMKKQFALKMLPQELSTDRSFIQRFEEDVGVLAYLEHPHIVKIHNVSFDQGCYFLVTDCIVDEVGETRNLAHYLKERKEPFSESELMRLLQQLADALDYAHSKTASGKGIAHLGIKLNNILVSKGDGGINLMFSDYGLTRVIGSGPILSRIYQQVADSLSITDGYANSSSEKQTVLHDTFLQSYQFLAPEQKYPRGEQRHQEADVYAFGVLAYYLMMKEFPEGIFPLPTEKLKHYRWNWDSLIRGCLQYDPTKRPKGLLPALDAVKGKGPTQLSLFAESQDNKIQQKVLRQEGAQHLQPIIHTASIERPRHDPDPAAVFQIDPTVKHYTPERPEIEDIQPLMTDMVVVQGGAFFRGSNDGNRDEMPRHKVNIASFAIDIHPVTNEQFVRFLEVMGGEKDNNHQDIVRLKESRIKRTGGKFSIESGYVKHPVVGVTWYGAVAYAKWVGKRLPTEAEWEIAARGGVENALYMTGDDIEKPQANFFNVDTTPVMSYPPNGSGLYDMAGNVYEWCHDWYDYNYYETSLQEPDDPKGPLQGVYRVLRGGCWKSLKEDLRCSRRHRNNPGTVNGTYGFRCATDVE